MPVQVDVRDVGDQVCHLCPLRVSAVMERWILYDAPRIKFEASVGRPVVGIISIHGDEPEGVGGRQLTVELVEKIAVELVLVDCVLRSPATSPPEDGANLDFVAI